MAKSDDTEETKVTGVEDIQNALEGTLDAKGEDQDTGSEDTSNEDDDDTSDESEEDDDSDDSSDDTNDDDSSEDDDDSEENDDDDDDSQSEHRFTQFKGDGTDKDYLKNLEEGYKNSSDEGIRLNQELETANRRLASFDRAVAADPKLAESLQKAMGGDQQGGSEKSEDDKNRDPFLRNSEREWREQSNKEAEEFAEANPEVLTDPKIKADVKRLMAKFSQMELDDNDRLMTAGEAMAKAYTYLGLDNKLKSKTDVAAQAKKDAAPARPQPSKKKAKPASKEFSDQQMKFAAKMGVSKETLSKYNK